jgi:hypothetical protein
VADVVVVDCFGSFDTRSLLTLLLMGWTLSWLSI